MFHLMEEHRLILSIDMLEGDTQVEELRDVITECPNLKIAIGHFGMVTFPGWTEQIKLARYPNVFIESGGITWLFNDEFYPFKGAVRAIREAAGLVGMEKLMWGSDYPRTLFFQCYFRKLSALMCRKRGKSVFLSYCIYFIVHHPSFTLLATKIQIYPLFL